MLHVCMDLAKRVNESCHAYEWFMSHMRMIYVAYLNVPCHTYGQVMSSAWEAETDEMGGPTVTRGDRSHVTHICVMSRIYESCHAYMSHVTHIWVMPRINLSHITHTSVGGKSRQNGRGDGVPWVYKSCHTYTRHVTHIYESCHTYQCWRQRQTVRKGQWRSMGI